MQQARWGDSNDERRLWKNEVWKMHLEELGHGHQGTSWNRMLRKYHQVRLPLSRFTDRMLQLENSLHSADQVRQLWWPKPDMESWSLERLDPTDIWLHLFRFPERVLQLGDLYHKVGMIVVMTSYVRLIYGLCIGRTMDADAKTRNIMEAGVQKIL